MNLWSFFFPACQDDLQEDEDIQAKKETDILSQYQKDAQSFGDPQMTVLG